MRGVREGALRECMEVVQERRPAFAGQAVWLCRWTHAAVFARLLPRLECPRTTLCPCALPCPHNAIVAWVFGHRLRLRSAYALQAPLRDGSTSHSAEAIKRQVGWRCRPFSSSHIQSDCQLISLE